jgi:hypothetical protein
VFREYDKNGDEQVTLNEWYAMKGVGEDDTARRELEAKRFLEADPNHDGKMTVAEFLYWYSKGRFEAVPDRAKPRDGEGPAKSGARDGEK